MDYFLQKAKKYADKSVSQIFEQIFKKIDLNPISFIVNERMLHFPEQIAGLAFQSLWLILSFNFFTFIILVRI